jgi:iron complex outermembrane receptor protein
MKKSHKRLIACLLLLSATAVANQPGVLAAGEETDKADAVFILDEIVVTAPRGTEPLVVETDPQAPRLPIPSADGGGYLKSIPGFSVVRQGGTGSDPLLRGLGGTRLNVLLDGTAQLGGCPSRMDPTTSYAFPESFSKITVLKGPESVLYGGGNVAGTVLFERDTAPFEKPAVRVNSSILAGSAGRNDELLDVTAGDTSGYVRIIKTRSHADDYEDGDGNTVRSFYTRQSLTGIVGLTPDPNTLYEFAVDTSTAEAAYGGRSMDGTKFDQQNYSFTYEKKHLSPLVSSLEFKVYHNYVDHVMDNFTFRTPSGMMGAMVSNVDRTTTGGRLVAKLSLSPATEANVGFDYQKNEHTKRGMGTEYKSFPRKPDLNFTNYGVFGDIKRTLDSHNRLLGGLRADSLEVKKLSPATAEDNNHTYGAFLRYEHDYAHAPLTSYVGVGHAQRPADYWERTKGASNSTFFLNPEKNTQLDTGIIYSSGKLRASLSAFYSNIDDFILITGSSSASNIDATLYGGEADVSYSLSGHWTATATLAYVRGTNDTGNKPLAQIPPLEGTIGLKYNKEKVEAGLLWRGVQAQTRYDVGSGSEIGLDIGRSSGFGILSASVAYRPAAHIVVAAGVDNIFDKNYAEFVSRAGVAVDGIPATIRINEPGRTVWVKTSYNF